MVGHYRIREFYNTLSDKRIACKLCPNMCIISDGYAGLCLARKNIGGAFYSLSYGRPCSIHIDPIEKKPLYHYAPGQSILSLGTLGCNLFCRGCQNSDISRTDPDKNSGLEYVNPEDVVKMALGSGVKMIAYTYNEPTVFYEYMVDIAKSARKQGIKNIIVSNGYINPAPLKKLCRYVDAANIDIKGFTEKFYSSYTGTSLKPVLKSIKALHDSGKWVELTNLVIPGLNDDPKYMQKMCLWIRKNLGTDVPVHFSRFYPYYRSKDIPITPVNTLMNARSIAMNAGLRYVYTGNLGVMDNTYCHKCKSLLIKRAGYDIKVIGLSGAKNNRCSGCGAVIPGIFTF